MTGSWQGSFVSGGSPSEAGDPAPYFRREFEVADGLQGAILRVTALGIVESYLNGLRVGDEVLAPGWTSYRHRLMVSTYDVTDVLSVGANAVGAIVGEGWAVGALSWENRRHNYADRPALFLQLELEYADRTEVIGTDERFRVGTGAVQANGVYAGETYDARLDPAGWHTIGFDDSGWTAAQPFTWDLGTLESPRSHREPPRPSCCRCTLRMASRRSRPVRTHGDIPCRPGTAWPPSSRWTPRSGRSVATRSRGPL